MKKKHRIDHRFKTEYEKWCLLPDLTEEERKLLVSMTEEEQQECFYRQVPFGTAGMRGKVGLGSNRINRYTIRLAAWGMAQVLGAGKKVAIAYDTRLDSKNFAEEAAKVLAEAGLKVLIFDRYSPVPLLSYTVRELHCDGGIVITASHNTKAYNGFKTYEASGAQMGPNKTEEIFRWMLKKADPLDVPHCDDLVQENIGLVKHIVSRYTARGVEKEDLFQIGMIGLLKAIDYFDLSYDVRFSTYAVPMIAGEIRRFMRDNGAIKVSRSIKDNRAAVNRSREQLLEKLGREPTLSEIVKDVGMSMEDVLLAVNSGQEVASLQQTIYDGDGSSIRLMDKLSARSGEGDAALDRMMLADSLSALDQREREIIVLRFYYDQTQSQIAKRMGVSQVQVSRLEKRILRKMKMYIC